MLPPKRFSSLPINRALFALLFVITLQAYSEAVAAQSFVYSNGSANTEVALNLLFSPGGTPVGGTDRNSILVPGPQFVTISRAFTDGFSDTFGEGAAYQDQFGINAVFVNSNRALEDAVEFTGFAKSYYDVTIKTTTRETGTIPFSFVINGGQLRIDNFSDYNPTLFGGVGISADISIASFNRWRMTVKLTKDAAGNPVLVYDEFLPGNLLQTLPGGLVAYPSEDSLGLGFPPLVPTMVGDSVIVDIPRFEATIDLDLDEFSPGGLGARFTYGMAASVEIANSFGVSGFAGVSDPFGLGDPTSGTEPAIEFLLDGQPISAFTPVPIPAGLWLLLSGLGGLRWFSSRCARAR